MAVGKQLWHWLGKVALSKLLALLLIYWLSWSHKQTGLKQALSRISKNKGWGHLSIARILLPLSQLCSGMGLLQASLLSCKPGDSCHLFKSISRALASYVLFHDEVSVLHCVGQMPWNTQPELIPSKCRHLHLYRNISKWTILSTWDVKHPLEMFSSFYFDYKSHTEQVSSKLK